MHQYEWDPETGGILLKPQQSKSSNEPRPVYYREMNLLHMDQRWAYPQNDDAPIMWAEAEKYIYRGRIVARTKGGSLYTPPEVIYTETEEGEPAGSALRPVDVEGMVEKNRELMENLVDETAKKIYNRYRRYKKKVNLFYVAFSGGKDSVVALDMVQRTLPHNAFKVIFGDTQMEFPDTYQNVQVVEDWCKAEGIEFKRAASKIKPQQSWRYFGPPAAEVRWCCSVHKTAPQILLLRELTGKHDFTGMAFTGIRGDESAARQKYDDLSEGKKHQGQFSYHVIFEWNSAEIYLHIFANHLPIGESYYKGIPRAGCLICPNAVGRSDFFRRAAYPEKIDYYLDIIRQTSIKKDRFTESQMSEFINNGNWRTRRTGRELNFGKDVFEYKQLTNGEHVFSIAKRNFFSLWMPWLKTISEDVSVFGNSIQLLFGEKIYNITYSVGDADGVEVVLHECYKAKADIRFLSLLKSTIIKASYCINCGVCEAECKNDCIHCSTNLTIQENCKHCYQCHEVHERCIRYFSIRNKEREEQIVGKIDRYASFGFRESWLQSFFDYNGEIAFWESDADGLAPNKRQDACWQFMTDAGLITGKWKNIVDPNTKEKIKDFTPIKNTKLANRILELGCKNKSIWAVILVNLVSNQDVPTFRWFLQNCEIYQTYDEKDLINLLVPAFANDEKGHGKQNVVDSLKILLATTPLGNQNILSSAEYSVKTTARGEMITLNNITRMPWPTPIPEVILYSLYKFAKACGDYYQFTLSYLMDETIERDGVSPTTIFGLDRDTMIRILNGLAINYPEFISVSFSFDLDTITLRRDKTPEDVLELL